MTPTVDNEIQLFSTCPPATDGDGSAYYRQVVDAARWSEKSGCRGILVYSDNSQADPWLIAHLIVQHTESLCPLVAVQPVYMHPYTLAKAVSSIGHMHGRRVYLNLVAGGFRNDLLALNDNTPHDNRYSRLIEYMTVVRLLLADDAPVSYAGKFYQLDKLRLRPSLPKELFPGILVSGSSDAGLEAARTLGATAIKYPAPVKDCSHGTADTGGESGIRVGIIAREREAEAWTVARTRFPEDRKGQLTHELAMKVSDSVWHRQLSGLAEQAGQTPYWLVPFQNYKSMCPYLVGNYQSVGQELAGYVSLNYRTFITDVVPDAHELDHIRRAFACAMEEATCPRYSSTG